MPELANARSHLFFGLGAVFLSVEVCFAFSGIAAPLPASHARALRTATWKAQLSAGATVAVVGASSRIGKFVADKLQREGRYNLKLIAGAPEASGGFSEQVRRYRGNMAQKDLGDGINLLEETGETGLNGQSPGRIVPADDVLNDVAAVIIADSTTTFPNEEWLLGRAPSAVDARQVFNTMQCLGPQTEHVVFLSCMGAKRELPLFPRLDANILFWILDRFGALSAKRQGEELVKEAAKRFGFTYSIVRPKLHCYETGWAGGLPPDAFEALQYEAVQLVPGDLIDGETSDQTAAEALVQCLTQPAARNRCQPCSGGGTWDFCVTNTRGPSPSGPEAWDALFESLAEMEKQLADSLR